MNTFKFLSLFVAVYGLQVQAQNYDGGSSYGGLYNYYQGQSQDQAQGQSQDQQIQGYGQPYGNYGQPSQAYGNSYGQAPTRQQDQTYGSEGSQYGSRNPYDSYYQYYQGPQGAQHGSRNPYDSYYQYYQGPQGAQQSQAPSNSYGSPYGNAYGSSDPYGFDAQDLGTPSRRGFYGQSDDQYGQYGTPNPPTGPYQGPQTTPPNTRSQRSSRDGYGYQDPHRGQIGSRQSQSDMDSFAQDQKKSCDAKLNETQKKALIDIVEKSVGGDEGNISEALKNKKITLLGTSVKQQGSAVDCKFQSQVMILFKSNNSLTCTVKATASIDSGGKAAFGKEQNFSCGDESRETNVRTGVEVYKTNYQGPTVAPSKGGRA